MVDNSKQSEKTFDGKEQIKINLNKDIGSFNGALKHIKSLIDPISLRFTKKYESSEEDITHFM